MKDILIGLVIFVGLVALISLPSNKCPSSISGKNYPNIPVYKMSDINPCEYDMTHLDYVDGHHYIDGYPTNSTISAKYGHLQEIGEEFDNYFEEVERRTSRNVTFEQLVCDEANLRNIVSRYCRLEAVDTLIPLNPILNPKLPKNTVCIDGKLYILKKKKYKVGE